MGVDKSKRPAMVPQVLSLDWAAFPAPPPGYYRIRAMYVSPTGALIVEYDDVAEPVGPYPGGG